jgi:hypothetical protein
MGMFDTVIVNPKFSLPLPKDPKGYTGTADFQTKELDNFLETYEIRKDGSLWKLNYRKKNEEKTWSRVKNVPTVIKIYDYQENNEGDFDYFIEYEILFTKDKVKTAKLIKFEANNNTKRKENQKMYDEQWAKRKKFVNTWLFKNILVHWNKAIGIVYRFNTKILGFLSIVNFKLINLKF